MRNTAPDRVSSPLPSAARPLASLFQTWPHPKSSPSNGRPFDPAASRTLESQEVSRALQAHLRLLARLHSPAAPTFHSQSQSYGPPSHAKPLLRAHLQKMQERASARTFPIGPP